MAFKRFKIGKHNSDGIYKAYESEMKFMDFKTESEMQMFIADNIEDFCKNVLGDKLVSFECEKGFGKYAGAYGARKQYRIDICIIGENKKYIVEIKNPKAHCDCRNALGQLLVYSSYFNDHELVLVTSKYDLDAARAIEKFALPIRYICLSREISAEVINHDANRKT